MEVSNLLVLREQPRKRARRGRLEVGKYPRCVCGGEVFASWRDSVVSAETTVDVTFALARVC